MSDIPRSRTRSCGASGGSFGGESHATRWRGVLRAAGAAGVRTHVTPYPLAQANEALDALRNGRLTGAAVLVP